MAVLSSLRASSCVLPKAEQPSKQGYESDIANRLARWRDAQRRALGITDSETLPALPETKIKRIKHLHKPSSGK